MISIEPKANDEMVRGYLDGLNLSNPEPSANRSRSYRHGFASGRADRGDKRRAGMTFEEINRAADVAMALDAADAMPSILD
jgi:hypothetical protein